ncbi:MAG: helix-turn-helix domain-containing protein [Chloroflexota bacterium]|nr:helix-turn-helix domain-containing protein [Chloroflexota bacterium]
MASESESEPNARPRSKEAKRFIERARNIGEDPEFKAKLNQVREDWNQDYPAYKIRTERVSNIVKSAILFEDGLPLPPPLAQAIKPWHDGSWEKRFTGIHDPGAFNDLCREMEAERAAALDAISTWGARVDLLTPEGWPPDLYPNWSGPFAPHPARRFVAACLIWGPNDLRPEEWIEPIPYTGLIQTIPFDPSLAIPDVFRWKTAFDTLAALVEQRGSEGTPLTPEESDEIIGRARYQGDQVGNTVSEWATKRDPEGFRFVRLHRGMNTQDWRDLEPAFIQSQIDTYGEDQWADEARRRLSEGWSREKIAREMGVNRRTVGRWTKEQS